MTVRYTFLNTTGQWAAIGPVTEMRVGPIEVMKVSGQAKTERIIKLSAPFNKDGAPHCFGFLATLPRGSAKSQPEAPVISEEQFAAVARAERSRQEADLCRNQLIRLLNYTMNMQEDYPDLTWPDLPDTYDKSVWQCVA